MEELAVSLESAAAEAPLVKTASDLDGLVIDVPAPQSGAPPAPQPNALYSAPAPQPDILYAAPAIESAAEASSLYGAPLPGYAEDTLSSASASISKTASSGMMMDPWDTKRQEMQLVKYYYYVIIIIIFFILHSNLNLPHQN